MATELFINDDKVINRIIHRLDDVCFTDQYLVEAIPLEHDKLQDYLSGKNPMPFSLLERIANLLSVDVEWLLGQQENKC